MNNTLPNVTFAKLPLIINRSLALLPIGIFCFRGNLVYRIIRARNNLLKFHRNRMNGVGTSCKGRAKEVRWRNHVWPVIFAITYS